MDRPDGLERKGSGHDPGVVNHFSNTVAEDARLALALKPGLERTGDQQVSEPELDFLPHTIALHSLDIWWST